MTVDGIERPAKLRAGDQVALVAPSGWVPEELVAAAAAVLSSWDLRVRVGDNVLRRHFYLAGTDAERVADLNEAFRDPSVRAVLCMRGGYGAQRIVDDLDFAAVRADPKLFMGFSDITALHVALWCETGLATLHGPTASYLARSPDSATARDMRRALTTAQPVVLTADEREDSFGVRTAGRADGTLLGGNLSLLATTVGTRHRPDLTGAILMLEVAGEEPYRIDRSLVQLQRAGWLDGVAGVAVGQFTGCTDDGPTPTVREVLTEQLGSLGVPVLGGLPFGHGEQQTALGLGVPAVLDADAGTLTVQSPAL
ncbi:muramoyltetrapeptide carboxypeptidase [Actinoplanes octamycinicus]|uniref:Muramoyltetrapeptide carboxypeptidase n=1 Tax=Actinoplanes octamycinicus TaxID=135948 RepID=A0A7W7H0M9_9ACTN|nr:LD-carboxypeptidase [Actinoplanes octamycinicus]MBB4741674.1 muramoyltetrapeptide carboxypeptidase [Actinoplanes octamycinicus]GIE57227.1 peptidase S66 [Actinoplanes octamycinicus]